ncbi:hypothetical protein HYH03_014020 [Edaphochlamys debaryana]|uniref:Peroxin-5 n=1 Tax=Edaphochlamys debaryana TaxID=47281 RepID=A0A836BU11_9CHLO|nr:hypothetical protein HYH03_014020 [Edaphochlamys debaryana]|eukprot:KAG2487453.1 hypothetical protein HYH03_014020 [Edaphochlamys debaryana]
MAGGAGPSTSYGRPPPTPAELAMAGGSGMQVPGLGPPRLDHAAVEQFLQGIHGPPPPGMQHMAGPAGAGPAEWDAIFHGQDPRAAAGPMPLPPHGMPGPPMPGAPPPLLAPHFQAFVRGGQRPGPLAAPLPPELSAQLSVGDKVRIRDRSTILARHLYAEQGDRFADAQVGHLLASLRIDPRELPADTSSHHVHHPAWHDAWRAGAAGPGLGPAAELAAGGAAAAAAGPAPWDAIWRDQRAAGPQGPVGRVPSTGWATEFAAQQPQAPGAAWATEFAGPSAAATPAEQWASDFRQEQDAAAAGTADTAAAAGRGAADARSTTAALADVLSRSADPKMRNSKFLQFVSKMSKGELILGDNKVVEAGPQAGVWASEFTAQQGTTAGPAGWAAEFAQQVPGPGPSATASAAAASSRDWVDEFARGVADIKLEEGLDAATQEQLEAAWREGEAGAWAQEFNQGDEGTFAEWERIYGHGAVEEAALGAGVAAQAALRAGAAFGEYVFAERNPFLGDPEALAKGKDLFRKGVLSEAVLALEAAVRAHPESAEAWRLLGTVHAENDDDRQAIAAMMRAHAADPADPAVLLALGVSHTNELSQGEAVSHLRAWLGAQPAYAPLDAAAGPPPDSSQRLTHAIRIFESAAAQAPSDPELRVALGVLHHLARAYGPAVAAFEAALKLRPTDYSLWNKLGATLANHGRSAEALAAYQKALDLKPNYMRAWTNMGISYANLGDYDRSAAFYVAALGLNAGAEHVWGYLRTSLACGGRMELMGAVDAKDMGALQKALPLL